MEQRFPRRWDNKTKIDFLQRKIILLSIIYYELNNNLVSDLQFDTLSKQLVVMHQEYGDISDTQYGYVFYDFDASTGFLLFGRLNEHDKKYLLSIARMMLGDKRTEKDVKQTKQKTENNVKRRKLF